jgi:transcriptional regulator with XRE-family HTH domain
VRKRDRDRYRRLAQWLQQRRKELDLTGIALSRRSGIAQPLISDFERHERIPDVFDLVRLFKALGIGPDKGFALLETLMDDASLDRAPIPAPPPRLTKGRPKEPQN